MRKVLKLAAFLLVVFWMVGFSSSSESRTPANNVTIASEGSRIKFRTITHQRTCDFVKAQLDRANAALDLAGEDNYRQPTSGGPTQDGKEYSVGEWLYYRQIDGSFDRVITKIIVHHKSIWGWENNKKGFTRMFEIEGDIGEQLSLRCGDMVLIARFESDEIKDVELIRTDALSSVPDERNDESFHYKLACNFIDARVYEASQIVSRYSHWSKGIEGQQDTHPSEEWQLFKLEGSYRITYYQSKTRRFRVVDKLTIDGPYLLNGRVLDKQLLSELLGQVEPSGDGLSSGCEDLDLHASFDHGALKTLEILRRYID